jgi:hypothetical protein
MFAVVEVVVVPLLFAEHNRIAVAGRILVV